MSSSPGEIINYNKYTGTKILGWILVVLGILFLLVLFGYQIGLTPSIPLGSSFLSSGGAGELLAEIFILIVFLIAAWIIIKYGERTSISKKIVTDMFNINASPNPTKYVVTQVISNNNGKNKSSSQ